MGVDFEKAFNRMDHGECVAQLQELGALPGSLGLIKAFLSNRVMTIKLDGKPCGERPITKGSPQGSVLGCSLYCATTQRLTNGLERNDGMAGPVLAAELGRDLNGSREDHGFEGVGLPSFVDGIRFFPNGSLNESDSDDFWDPRDRVGDVLEEVAGPANRSPQSFKYIDDTTVFEAVSLDNAIKHITENKTQEVIRAGGLEKGLDRSVPAFL